MPPCPPEKSLQATILMTNEENLLNLSTSNLRLIRVYRICGTFGGDFNLVTLTKIVKLKSPPTLLQA